MNLISGIHHSCKRREHAFMVFREYTIISQVCGSRILFTRLTELIKRVEKSINNGYCSLTVAVVSQKVCAATRKKKKIVKLQLTKLNFRRQIY